MLIVRFFTPLYLTNELLERFISGTCLSMVRPSFFAATGNEDIEGELGKMIRVGRYSEMEMSRTATAISDFPGRRWSSAAAPVILTSRPDSFPKRVAVTPWNRSLVLIPQNQLPAFGVRLDFTPGFPSMLFSSTLSPLSSTPT